MKNDSTFSRVLRGVNRFLLYFLFVAFVISCCMMLFISILRDSLGLTLTGENISLAAKVTFLNVILISLLFTAVDILRRKWMVERPVRMISDAAEKMIQGDFSVRIPPVSRFSSVDGLSDVIECINKMAEELSGVETLRTDFIANVSHEMKTPLAVIQNYATLLSGESVTDSQRAEYAAVIRDAARRLSDMMTNILKLSRLENQRIYPKTEIFDLGEQLCECLLGFESIWEGRGIEIETDIAEGVLVSGDSELLSLVWNNLFSNAFKFSEEGDTVSVLLSRDGDCAVVSIKDTGIGMSSEVGAHIFEKFYQADSSRATQGNGLGLALVKRVIDIMGADISVSSAVGVGTTFTVRIRRADDGVEENR